MCVLKNDLMWPYVRILQGSITWLVSWLHSANCSFQLYWVRSAPPEVFLGKSVLKICTKFTGEHPMRSVVSIKLLCSFIEITVRHGCFPGANLSEWMLSWAVLMFPLLKYFHSQWNLKQGVWISKVCFIISGARLFFT